MRSLAHFPRLKSPSLCTTSLSDLLDLEGSLVLVLLPVPTHYGHFLSLAIFPDFSPSSSATYSFNSSKLVAPHISSDVCNFVVEAKTSTITTVFIPDDSSIVKNYSRFRFQRKNERMTFISFVSQRFFDKRLPS